MLDILKTKNPELPFFSVLSPEFSEYGRIINELDLSKISEQAEKIPFLKSGSGYIPSVAEFESLAIADQIRDLFFGELPIQIGITYGHSNKLNALEWHASSEINIAVSDLVILVAKRSEIENNSISASKVKAFFVPKGTALECYATTLHFCPCEANADGFRWIVALPVGTNTPLEKPSDDPLLYKKNKWVIIHKEHTAMAELGAAVGIEGENFVIKY